jgi:hypothetical protein
LPFRARLSSPEAKQDGRDERLPWRQRSQPDFHHHPSLLFDDLSLQPPSGGAPNLPFSKHPSFDK